MSHSILQTSSSKFEIEIKRSLTEFHQLKEDWDKCTKTNTNYKPFLCHDWFSLWFQHFLHDQKLYIIVLSSENKPVAIAPFLIKKETVKGIPLKKMELVGNVYSPIRNFIFANTSSQVKYDYCSAIFSFLQDNKEDWDLIDLSPLNTEDNLFDVLLEVVKNTPFTSSTYTCFGNYYISEIDCSGDEYLEKRPKKIRKDINYQLRRLERTSNLEFNLIKSTDQIDSYMNQYYSLYAKSWQKEEGIGPTFHRDLARILAANNWLRLGFLLLNELPIATQYWVVCDKTAYIMKTVYDQNFAKFSPGKILTFLMTKHVIDKDNVTQLDYLHGDEPYKRDWLPHYRERTAILLFNNNLRGRYLSFLFRNLMPFVGQSKTLIALKKATVNLFRGRTTEIL